MSISKFDRSKINSASLEAVQLDRDHAIRNYGCHGDYGGGCPGSQASLSVAQTFLLTLHSAALEGILVSPHILSKLCTQRRVLIKPDFHTYHFSGKFVSHEIFIPARREYDRNLMILAVSTLVTDISVSLCNLVHLHYVSEELSTSFFRDKD
jgi:hypothetical protein